MDSRKESLAATPSSLSSASSPQCDSLPYYKQDDTMEDEHFAGSHNGRHFEKQFCVHIKTSFNVYPSLGYPYSYTAIDHVQQKGVNKMWPKNLNGFAINQIQVFIA